MQKVEHRPSVEKSFRRAEFRGCLVRYLTLPRWWIVVVISVQLFWALPAQAVAEETRPDFWESLADPGKKKFDEALRRGRNLLKAAEKLKAQHLQRQTLRDAVAAFKEATVASPRRGSGYYWLGLTYYQLNMSKGAIFALKRARQLSALQTPEQEFRIAFNLGITYSKVGDFESAVREYDRAERPLRRLGKRNSTVRANRSLCQGNAAESLMALGRLDEAIQRYKAALALYHNNRVLLWWGLAVALDRDEQTSKASEALGNALREDPSMRALTSDTVFFVPRGDIHYYFALGHMAQGQVSEAKKRWRQFLDATPRSVWAYRARTHLAMLGAAPRKNKGSKKKRLAPRPGTSNLSQRSSLRERIAVRYTLEHNFGRLRKCYLTLLRKKPNVSGRARLTLRVGKDGSVQRAKVTKSTIRDHKFSACLSRSVSGIKFGKLPSGRAVRLSIPLEFKPNK